MKTKTRKKVKDSVNEFIIETDDGKPFYRLRVLPRDGMLAPEKEGSVAKDEPDLPTILFEPSKAKHLCAITGKKNLGEAFVHIVEWRVKEYKSTGV